MATPRVLIVEDDPLVLRTMHRGLAPVALVEMASSVTEARELLSTATTPWDACIVDGELGDGTALDVLELLGAERPPVLVVTGTHDARLLRALADAGVLVLRKPFTMPELIAALRVLWKQ